MSVSEIFKVCRTVAVVGASPNPDRASHRVFNYLCEHGFKAIPVNPTATEVSGLVCYPNLSAVPEKIDCVDVFRRSEDVLPIVEEAIKIGAKAIWLQEGIVNGEAEAKALAAGLLIVQDRCIMKEHRRLAYEG
ncbi:MAG: CoA-binding protein [Dehalococcoidia bacterium]|nr:CoA-binding protein [Dehalococcoidia bacterium]